MAKAGSAWRHWSCVKAGRDDESAGVTQTREAGTRRSLLIVEDDATARRLIVHALRRRYRVLEADDFASTVELLGRDAVNLVLLDLHLPPRVDSPTEGLRAHAFLRERLPDLPVLVITANADPRLARRLRELGASGFLAKPVDPAELIRKVQALLGDEDPGDARP